MQNRQALLVKEKMAYGCGDAASNMMWGMTSSYLMYYYTDIYGLPLLAVSWILLVARVVDAFCDPAIGYIVDRMGGMIIPRLIRLLAIPFGLTGFLCFLALPLSPTGKVVWAGTTYIVFGAIYSCINTPYGALAVMMSRSATGRVGLNAFRMMGCQAGSLLVALLTIPAITWLGGGESAAQHRYGMAVYVLALSVLCSFLWLCVARGCTIRHAPAPVRQNPMVTLRHLCANRHWVLSNLLAFFYFVGQAALFGFVLYYARVILGGTEQLGANIITFITVLLFAGVPACLPLARRMGTARSGIICLMAQGAAYLMMAVAGASMTGFVLSVALLALAQGVMSPLYYTLLAEAVDDGDPRTSTGAAGLAYSINTWVTKLAMGLTGFVLAQFLSQGHYIEGGLAQPPELSAWIMAGFVWLPLGAVCMQALCLLAWRGRA
ncbi:MFS transporter [Komagataeibacter xylinus]|uniref:MFS transporter n=1 Tax=Komagataeibacter xylinus TaxID=28448 RepID=A0A318PR75_KOMXY|nr:MFS transporter [Komagataeibacter xylinus]AZV39548.1 MFS transporter [Komagataeibacter xylinus]PYD57729.1 MFS transporter [Komagataeibacter xylinus]GBQ72314.1 sugar transporter [Komagataeibacter xylinus NBRC 15237]